MKLKTVLLTAVALSTLVQAKTERIYFGTSDSRGIYFADFDSASGKLETPQLAIAIPRPAFIAIHPSGQSIYCTTPGGRGRREALVTALKILPDGRLETLNRRPAGGQGTCHVSTDATGQTLMAAHYGSGGVSSFKILADGSLSPICSRHQHSGSGADPRRQQGPHAHSIFPDPKNRFAYAPDLGIDAVKIYRLDPAAGTLTPHGEARIPGRAMGPRHMKWARDGRFAYVLNELDLSVSVFKPGAKPGTLEHVATRSSLPDGAEKSGMTSSEIRIHPNGKFVYAANRDTAGRGRDTLAVFSSADQKGGFKRIETVPAEVGVPRNFNLDPSGKWLLAGGQRSHEVAIFKVDQQTGRLTFTGTRVPFEGGPICIEFMP